MSFAKLGGERNGERKRIGGEAAGALVGREAIAELLVDLEAEEEERPHLVGVGHLSARLGIDTACRLTHRLERGPRMRVRKKAGEKVTTAGLVDEIGIPPAEPPRRAPPLACPRDRELGGQNRVERRVGQRHPHL